MPSMSQLNTALGIGNIQATMTPPGELRVGILSFLSANLVFVSTVLCTIMQQLQPI